MARKKPQTMSQFRKVSGVGELKASWYGAAFLNRIKEYLDSNEGSSLLTDCLEIKKILVSTIKTAKETTT